MPLAVIPGPASDPRQPVYVRPAFAGRVIPNKVRGLADMRETRALRWPVAKQHR